jgi:hypothetical protein
VKYLRHDITQREDRQIDCTKQSVQSLTEMFVNLVQAGRIKRGQCPALRPWSRPNISCNFVGCWHVGADTT